MRPTPAIPLVALAMLVVGGATAHPMFYVQGGIGDSLGVALTCGEPHVWPPDPTPDGVGAVCFGPWHINRDPDGLAWIWVDDAVNPPTSGYVCQDLNLDSACGTSPGELAEVFCGTALLGNGDNWRVWEKTWVYVDGPVFGNPLLSACGLTSWGSMGRVWHGP